MNLPYKDPKIPIKDRVSDLLKRMSLEQKIGQVCQLDGSYDPKIWINERNIGSYLNLTWDTAKKFQEMALNTPLGIPLIFGADAVHGHCYHDGAIIFPSQLALSCSWNPELLEKIAKITAKEMIKSGFHWNFSPILCIGRDARWGRISETFGEDPFLIGKLASAMVRGYQGKNLSEEFSVSACPKHYAAYGETIGGRDSTDAELSKNQMLSIFLPPFKETVDAGCMSIMAGYHAIDGIPCSANKWLLKEILRDSWGFKGVVLTDWNNLGWLHLNQMVASSLKEAITMGVNSGNDMIMSTPEFYEIALESVKDRTINEEIIDKMCSNVLNLKFSLGLFEEKGKPIRESNLKEIGTNEHKKVAFEAALQSIVLLKNKNNILPLKKDIGKIAVIGPNADNIVAQLGDWSFRDGWGKKDPDIIIGGGHTKNTITVLNGIRNKVEGQSEVFFCKGCDVYDPNNKSIDEAIRIAENANVVIVVIGDSFGLIGERKDRASLNLTGAQQELIEALKLTKIPLVVVLINGKPLTIPWVVEEADAVIEAWNPGMEGGNAISSILFGERNPSGKLTISFPLHVGQIPVYYNQKPGWHFSFNTGGYVDLPSTPLFPFGFGLSYTTFSYSNLRLSDKNLGKEDILFVSVNIKNEGNFQGTEIVQLYVNDLYSSVTTPIKELKGFTRVDLEPDEEKIVVIKLPISALSLINADGDRMVETGVFEIMVGSSSKNEDLLKEIINVR